MYKWATIAAAATFQQEHCFHRRMKNSVVVTWATVVTATRLDTALVHQDLKAIGLLRKLMWIYSALASDYWQALDLAASTKTPR
jgi:hypothetical protein